MRGASAPSLRRPLIAIGALLGLTTIGTAGYVVLEGASPFDALYLTVITLSTVGYGEVVPLHTAGRACTLCLIVFGVGAVLYLETAIGDLVWRADFASY